MAYLKPLSRGNLPGGYDPVFVERYKFSSTNGRTVTITPAIARSEDAYVNAGFRVHINGGRDRPASIARQSRGVLLHPDFLQTYVGGSKPLSQFTREECRGAVQANWDIRDGYGVISSGAQEARYENDPWAQDYHNAPEQYIWIEEKWAELAAAYPGTVNVGPYDGVAILNPNQFSEAQLQQAQSSPANAHAFMLQYESVYYPYFKRQMWKYKMPLINQYQRGSTNSHDRAVECRLTIRIVQLALEHVGRDPEEMCIFVLLNKAEFTRYTTRHKRLLQDGGFLISYDFTNYSVDFMLFLTFMLRKVRHQFCWEDTSYARKGTAVVPADLRRDGDNFLLITTENSNLPKAGYQVSPYDANVTYPCLHSPHAGEDMAGLAALWYQKLWAHVQKKSQNASFRQPGGSFIDVTATYDYDRWKNKEPYVEVAEDGINYTIIIEDFFNNTKAQNTIDVKLPSGNIISNVTYWTGTVNAFRGQR